jgi:hypothetical protein
VTGAKLRAGEDNVRAADDAKARAVEARRNTDNVKTKAAEVFVDEGEADRRPATSRRKSTPPRRRASSSGRRCSDAAPLCAASLRTRPGGSGHDPGSRPPSRHARLHGDREHRRHFRPAMDRGLAERRTWERPRGRGAPDVESAPADASGAKAALDRIAIPAPVRDAGRHRLRLSCG